MIGPIFHYQDNGNEAFWGRLITGNDHNGHDHIHYRGSLHHNTTKTKDNVLITLPPI
jgi:hypothetical protein